MTAADFLAEPCVLGAIFAAEEGTLPPNLQQTLDLAPDGWADPVLGQIAVAIRDVRNEASLPVTLTTVGGRLRPEHAHRLATLKDDLPLDLAEMDAEKLLELMGQRRTVKLLGEAYERAKEHKDRAPEIAAKLLKDLGSRNGNGKVALIAKRLADLQPSETKDRNEELLRYRFLCRGGGLLLAAPTGIGKSVAAMQCMIAWQLGRPAFGIAPAGSLKSLIINGEDDAGDMCEARDGVIQGMELEEEQAKLATENVIVFSEDGGLTGNRFLTEVVRPLLQHYRPDILWLNPILSFLGASASKQEEVSTFLRSGLNPLLREFGCAAIIIAHTNKPPSGKEKSAWRASDFSYAATGSIEWANWARAVLTIRSIGSHDVFELMAPKRGHKLGWRAEDGSKAYSKFIAHSPDKIFWIERGPDEVNLGGRPKSANETELIDLLPPEGLRTGDWMKRADSECGISKATFHRGRKNLEKSGRVLKSKITQLWQPVTKNESGDKN